MHYLYKLINLGVTDDMSSLRAIRQKYVNALSILFLCTAFSVGVLFLCLGQYTKLSIAFIAVTSFTFALYLSIKQRLEAAIVVLCLSLNFVILSGTYFHILSPAEIVPQAGCLIYITLFLLWNNNIRIIYIFLCAIVMALTIFEYDIELSVSISTHIQMLILIILHGFFILFVESQDKKINTTVSALESSVTNTNRLNVSLKTKNEEMTTFTQVMSHDLKTPLINITSFLGLLERDETFEKESSNKYFSFIKKSTNSMSSLIEDLLTYSKASNESVLLQKVDLNKILAPALLNFQPQIERNEVKIYIKPLPHVTGNESLLKILFQNLIGNSVKYQPKHIENHIPAIQIYAQADEKYDHIRIEDNGIGIDQDYIKNLFEPFKRFHNASEYEGSGLGMSICLKIMEKHKGALKLISTSASGTIFELSFPKTSSDLLG